MARRHLGVTIDLHGGGADLLYPHHESERAQSESANRAPFVRRWLHTGMVRYQGEKMSKSLGNLVFPRDLFRDHEPAAIRLALLAHHWRSEWEWDAAELKEATERLSAWRQAVREGEGEAGEGGCGQPDPLGSPVGYPPVRGPHQSGGGGETRPGGGATRPGGGAETQLPEGVDAALAADLDTPAALAVGDDLAEHGDGPGVAATAAVLGIDLGPATG